MIVRSQTLRHGVGENATKQTHRPRCCPGAAFDNGSPTMTGPHIRCRLAAHHVAHETCYFGWHHLPDAPLSKKWNYVTAYASPIGRKGRRFLGAVAFSEDQAFFSGFEIAKTKLLDSFG